MTEQKPELHPMQKTVLGFLQEALTLVEAEARINLLVEVLNSVESDIERIKSEANA